MGNCCNSWPVLAESRNMLKMPQLAPPKPREAIRLTEKDASQAALKCPICKDVHLETKPLEDGPAAAECSRCGGKWIKADDYWKWVESHPATSGAKVDLARQRPVKDSGPGKFCPGCGRFLSRAKPGHGLDFHINRCGGCGGIWLDANEWENLRDAGLHDDIHFIFSPHWQADLAKAQREVQRDRRLAEKIGSDSLNELKRIKAWLDSHPNKAELSAFLMEPHV